MLDFPAYCFGCGSPLPSHGWHVVDRCAFCPRCPNINLDACREVLTFLTRPMFYRIIVNTNGICWLSPVDETYRGHSIWRIYQAAKAREHGDHEAANWFLTHPKANNGPEDARNTLVPTPIDPNP